MRNIYYENGNLLRETISIDRTNKQERYYYEDGSIKSVYPYRGDVLYGEVIWFSKEGSIISKELYKNGVLMN